MRPQLLALALLLMGAGPAAKKPPVVSLVQLRVKNHAFAGKGPIDKVVRVAHPVGWDVEKEPDGRSVRLYGPEGEGEILIAAAGHPSELGPYLEELKQKHPGSAPSPPQAMTVPGIDPERGERATRFVITGHEVGEMVMIERGELIVLFASIVDPTAWEVLKTRLDRCYPTVQVSDRAERDDKADKKR